MNNGKKWIDRGQIVIWVISLLPVLITAAVYPMLPEQIPTHWELGGEVEYGAKHTIWMLAGMAPFFGIMFFLLPKMDPRRKNYHKFQKSYQNFQLYLQLFMLAAVSIILVESIRPGTVQVDRVICAMCSVLFLIIGNMMPKFRQNYFCGFKTPWTIASEVVWNKTHRLGGRMMFAAGLIGLVGAALPDERWRFALLFVPVMTATIVPGVMSYVWYRRLGEG